MIAQKAEKKLKSAKLNLKEAEIGTQAKKKAKPEQSKSSVKISEHFHGFSGC